MSEINIVEPSVELLWITENAEKQIEAASRICYKSEKLITDDSAGAFVKKMTKLGHHAMIEHAVASFKIVCDRGITHEIVRHRLSSVAQESTRYCRYSADKFNGKCTFIKPPGMNEIQEKLWFDACVDSQGKYFDMLSFGCSPQIARSVLPTCLKSEIVVMMNFRSWRHFISLRSSKAAHPQIRPISNMIYDILVKEAPNVFGDLFEGKGAKNEN